MRIIFILLVFASYLFGCTSKEEKKKQEELQRKQQKAEEKKNLISNLVTKYNIAYQWDTLEYEYSIQYKPVIESKFQLIEDFEIVDFFYKDSSEFVTIKSGFLYPDFYFDLNITKDQENQLLTENDLILIVSINEIRKLKFDLTGEIEDSETAILNLDLSSDFMGSGKIIDIMPTNN